jgi:hypothetical protein
VDKVRSDSLLLFPLLKRCPQIRILFLSIPANFKAYCFKHTAINSSLESVRHFEVLFLKLGRV